MVVPMVEEGKDPANFTFFKERSEHRIAQDSKEDLVNVSSLIN